MMYWRIGVSACRRREDSRLALGEQRTANEAAKINDQKASRCGVPAP
jgi:hypothetical protein